MEAASIDNMTGDARAIRTARKMVKAMVASCRDDLCAVAELLTDELLTNAVQHGGGQFRLAASVKESKLRVVVSDHFTSVPVTVYPSGHDWERGRGMTIVAAMATNWGIERAGSDKSIWFELDLAEQGGCGGLSGLG
jgi:anti-sigma regulatory factor (Ser/Thr protein kinase)